MQKKCIQFILLKKTKKNCLSLHYNGANSYLFVNGTEIYKFKAKDSEIVASPLCLGNISKDWTLDNMKKTGLNGYVYDFSADYDALAVGDILDIHKYLTKKNNMKNKKMFRFIKKVFFVAVSFFVCNALNCIPMNNQECKVEQETINININEPSFYPYSVKISKYSGSWNNINNPYAKLSIPDVFKNMKSNFKN